MTKDYEFEASDARVAIDGAGKCHRIIYLEEATSLTAPLREELKRLREEREALREVIQTELDRGGFDHFHDNKYLPDMCELCLRKKKAEAALLIDVKPIGGEG